MTTSLCGFFFWLVRPTIFVHGPHLSWNRLLFCLLLDCSCVWLGKKTSEPCPRYNSKSALKVKGELVRIHGTPPLLGDESTAHYRKTIQRCVRDANLPKRPPHYVREFTYLTNLPLVMSLCHSIW